jgi:hypothetical protein
MMKRKESKGALARLYLLLGLVACVVFPVTVNAELTCDEVLNLTIPDTTILSAEVVAPSPSIPAYCKVEGYVTTRAVRGEPDNQVNFRIGLPVGTWNNKFYFQGIGGLAGSIPSIDFGLARGYASAATDTGHQGGPFDADWAYNNRTKEIDFGYRAIHVVTLAAKAITSEFYGQAPLFSYFFGVSNGGRQGLMEATRYPDDYDGIVAGAPVTDHIGFMLAFSWNARAVLSSLDSFIPISKLSLIASAVLAVCDGDDGLIDGIVSDPGICSFDPASLQCSDGDMPDCLTEGQVDSLRKIYAGPSTAKGKQIYPGIPKGHEDSGGWQPWIVSFGESPAIQADGTLLFGAPQYGFVSQEGFLRYMSFPNDDPEYYWRSFDFDKDTPKMSLMDSILTVSSNLAPFRNRGGKMIMYHGWADTCLSPYQTVDYFLQVQRASGGRDRTSEFLRLFMVPGMLHGAGGTGPNVFDAFGALEDWVEHGIAPDYLIASGGTPYRTRKMHFCRFLCHSGALERQYI